MILTAAILFLVMPCPSAGGPCDCSTCRAYSDKRSRCLCCVYHGVGGKRSVLDPAPSSSLMPLTPPLPSTVHFFLTSGLAEARSDSALQSRATSQGKDGGHDEDMGGRWLQGSGSDVVSSLPGFQRQQVQNEAEFGLEPILAVKSQGQKEALGTSRAVENFRRLLLQAGSV